MKRRNCSENNSHARCAPGSHAAKRYGSSPEVGARKQNDLSERIINFKNNYYETDKKGDAFWH